MTHKTLAVSNVHFAVTSLPKTVQEIRKYISYEKLNFEAWF